MILARLRPESLRWGACLLCSVLGAMMLVVPHQFESAGFETIRPHLVGLGTLLVLAGASIAWVTVLPVWRPPAHAVHALAGVPLLLLGLALLTGHTLASAPVYLALGFGVVAAAFSPMSPARESGATHGDLLALVTGLGAAATGGLMLVVPHRFDLPPDARWHLPLVMYGVGFLAGGIALAAEQFAVEPRRGIAAVAPSWGLAAVFVLWLVGVSWPERLWTGVALFGGLGALLVLLPWLAPRLRPADATSLRAHLALALVAAAAAPLTVAVALFAAREQRSVTAEALDRQMTLADALAQDTADYVNLHRAAVAALAAQPGLLDLPVERQRQVLRGFRSAYPSVNGFGTAGPNGEFLARSDDREGVNWTGSPVFEDARRTNQSSLQLQISPVLKRPVLTMGAPVRDAGGRFAGFVSSSMELVRLLDLLDQAGGIPGERAYIVDEQGRAIVHPDQSLVAAFADLTATPAVARFMTDEDGVGRLSYRADDGQQLAGYARVPDLGWGVVVERPGADALADVRRGRELAFGLLGLAIIGSAAVGVISAGQLTAPLESLATAAQRLAAGDATAPLPASPVAEVQQLAATFGAMRDQLAARTREREQAEAHLAQQNASLRASEARFRSLTESINDAIVTADSRGRITFWNPAAEAIFGYTAGEVLGRPIALLMPERLRAAHQVGLARLDAGGAPRVVGTTVELTGLRKGGREFPLELSLSSWESGEGRFYTGVLRDITERKRAEDALARHAQELARSNQELQQFAYVASHDLQEPLRMVASYTQLLDRRYRGRLDGDADDFIEYITDGALRMKRLIDDLLAYSRVGARGRAFAPVDCTALLERTLHNLKPAISEASAEVTHDPLPEVLGDEVQLEQLLQNLIANAIKFRGEASPRVHVTAEHDDGVWRFAVRDNGIGIEPQFADRIFGMFQRLHSRSSYPGTGIGLAICKKIVDQHGGKIWVESTLGQGATFYFTIPDRGGTAA